MAEDVADLYQRAFDLVGQQRFAEAKPLLEQCLRLGPGPSFEAPARQELARIFEQQGEVTRALELRMEVKRLAPDRHANLWKLAQLLASLGRPREALKEAQDAARLDPTNFRYTELIAQLRSTVSQQDPSAESPGQLHTDTALGFEIEIPEGWKIRSGLLNWVAICSSRTRLPLLHLIMKDLRAWPLVCTRSTGAP